MKTSRKLSRNLSDAGAISETSILFEQLENFSDRLMVLTIVEYYPTVVKNLPESVDVQNNPKGFRDIVCCTTQHQSNLVT